MFTGLIEDVGRVRRWRAEPEGGELTFETALPGKEISLGDSIAVNGCCLTVVKKAGRRLSVDVSPETLKRTNLADLREGDRINLERPLQANDRLGGHMVTGHVDAVGHPLVDDRAREVPEQPERAIDLRIERPVRLPHQERLPVDIAFLHRIEVFLRLGPAVRAVHVPDHVRLDDFSDAAFPDNIGGGPVARETPPLGAHLDHAV